MGDGEICFEEWSARYVDLQKKKKLFCRTDEELRLAVADRLDLRPGMRRVAFRRSVPGPERRLRGRGAADQRVQLGLERGDLRAQLGLQRRRTAMQAAAAWIKKIRRKIRVRALG
jgi:hypothetical protein